MIVHDTMASPVGPLLLTASDAGLTGVWFAPHRRGPTPAASWLPAADAGGDAAAVLAETRRQLDDYFAGARHAFDLPLAATGTPFQARVWAALRGIPYGETISYAELARRVAAPRAVRAVGGANGRNPLSIVVPCHRVVATGGALGGFGGGVERKAWLLDHERGAG